MVTKLNIGGIDVELDLDLKFNAKLPDRPSELIMMALEDLKKAEESKVYDVDMSEWHSTKGRMVSKCSICFAGSVMAFSMGVDIQGNYTPNDFDIVTAGKLIALDEFRVGQVKIGLEYFYRDINDKVLNLDNIPENRPIALYEEDREGFHAAMKELAQDFEICGL